MNVPVGLENGLDQEADDTIARCLDLDAPVSFFLYAGAGSGKTHSLVEAVKVLKHRERKRMTHGGHRVGIITYTNAAADEISGRLTFDPLVMVSTIHAFAWRLIEGYDRDIREWLRGALRAQMTTLEDELRRSHGVNQSTVDKRAQLASKAWRLEHLDSVLQFIYSPVGVTLGRDALRHSEVIKMAADFLDQPVLRNVLVDTHPVLLVDESQDTDRDLLEALLRVQTWAGNRFCLGLIGDSMQRIYLGGKHSVENDLPPGWAKPAKRYNRRCPKRVVRLLNAIRSTYDGYKQRPLDNKQEGVARLFVVNRRESPTFELEEGIAVQMAEASGDDAWRNGPETRKTLILEHAMAARRMGFEAFFIPLYRAKHLKTPLLDGTLPEARFFIDGVLPIVRAGLSKDDFALVEAVRARSPLMAGRAFAERNDQLVQLRRAGEAAHSLLALFQEGEPALFDVVGNVMDSGLLEVPELLVAAFQAGPVPGPLPVTADRTVLNVHALGEALRARFGEIERFAHYSSGLSPFDTHQGVKGREFPRVMVIASDAEAGGNLFSYDKLFGIKPPSPTDLKNERDGLDSGPLRTKRLLYVTCSRAEEGLALVFYTDNAAGVGQWAIDSGWFSPDEVVYVD